MLVIDGSMGEGGGQILRTSLALSILTGIPVTFEKIRARRSKPGLMRQHLTAVNAATQISQAKVQGAELYSKKLVFEPGEVVTGAHHFKVGTAGSVNLVLQTILPVLMLAEAPSTITIEGGSHNPYSPSFDFLDRVYLPLLERIGPKVSLELARHGFYPAGGAVLHAHINPCQRDALNALTLFERGVEQSRRAVALLSNLPSDIAERELSEVGRLLRWQGSEQEVRVVDSEGPGNVFWLEVVYEHLTAHFTSYGAKGKMAEVVAQDAIADYKAYLSTEAVVGQHLADQLLLPMALAGKGSFLTGPPAQHLLTHAQIIEKFIEVDCLIEREEDREGRLWKVTVEA